MNFMVLLKASDASEAGEMPTPIVSIRPNEDPP